MGRRLFVVGILLAVLGLAGAGCGASGKGSTGSSADGGSGTTATTAAPGLSPGESLPPVTSSGSGSGSGSTTSVPAAAGDHGPQQFHLPSGNIGCYIDATAARCDIGQRDWVAPPKPADCQLDYGNGITLDANGATIACAGDTVLGGSDVLDYGQSAQRGPFTCSSSQAGVTCKDAGTGHGFDLSRQAYKLY